MHSGFHSRLLQDKASALNDRLRKLTLAAPVMLFMKGTPSEPKCKFSRSTIALLNKHKAQYGSFNVLGDQDVRQGLKAYSNWPTYPQLFVRGSLVGGLDVLKELDEEGQLADILGVPETPSAVSSALPPKQPLEERLKALISSKPVVLFMKAPSKMKK